MPLRTLFIALPLLASSMAGCSDPAASTPAAPIPAPAVETKKVERGNLINKHTVPTNNDPNAVAPGP